MLQKALLASLERLIKDRRTLAASQEKVAQQERRIIGEIGRALPRIGFRLVSANGRPKSVAGGTARKRALPKTLKCPKCSRRFSRQMHVARHLSATHGTKATAGPGRKSAKK